MKKYILSLAVLVGCITLILFSAGAEEGGKSALELCFRVIIPGLFPFMVLSNLFLKTGGATLFEKMAGKITSRLFGLCGSALLPVAGGIMSGYPVGAALTGEMVKRGDISREEGERLLGFCNNPGPMFVMGSVAGMLGCGTYGGVNLWLSQLLGAIAVGFITGRGKPVSCTTKGEQISSKVGVSAITNSVKEGIRSIITVCGFVVFFAVFLGVLRQAGVYRLVASLIGVNEKTAQAALSGVLETTSGIAAAAKTALPIHIKLPFVSMLLGWSGLSVHMQVAAVTGGSGMNLKGYFRGKLLQTVLAPMFTICLMKILPVTVQTAVTPAHVTVKLFTWAFVFTVVLSINFLLIFSTFSGNKK